MDRGPWLLHVHQTKCLHEHLPPRLLEEGVVSAPSV